ncbi:hypothetical protein GWI33_008673 [Rhynchophorus ferrugineus]|uniref:Uncharacterized protein n=1 Tax=Rhynchophorus ferrugineus TaxID=354439 RepID=A0A834MDY6_RHYFE|nr:hypothetical protein GWI33_008673 [Rhynchophorus ferrugineus]
MRFSRVGFLIFILISSALAAPQFPKLGILAAARAEAASLIGGSSSGTTAVAQSNSLINVGDINLGGLGNLNKNNFEQTGIINQQDSLMG